VFAVNNLQIDFAIIGAPKSGSTSLYDYFANVRDLVAISEAKDFPVFSRPGEIEARFDSLHSFGYEIKSQKPQVIGDVNICFDKTHLQALREKSPDVRLILLIRSPRERILSSYSFNSERLLEDRTLQTALNEEALGVLPEKGTKDWLQKLYFQHSDYEKMINICTQVFSKEQLLVLDFDDLVKSFPSVLSRLTDFMGIPFDSCKALPKSNVTSGQLRFRFLSKILFQGKRTSKFWYFSRKIISQANRSKIRFWLRRFMRTKSRSSYVLTLDEQKLSEAARKELCRLEKNYIFLKNGLV
jgi:hypothetical protein